MEVSGYKTFRYQQMSLRLNSYSKFHLYSHFIFTTLYLTFREWKIDIDLSSFDGDPVFGAKITLRCLSISLHLLSYCT